jgi:hypothetical protein
LSILTSDSELICNSLNKSALEEKQEQGQKMQEEKQEK